MEHIWLERPKYEEAEKLYHEMLSKGPSASIAGEIEKARQHITKSLEAPVAVSKGTVNKDATSSNVGDVSSVIQDLKKENNALRKAVEDLQQNVKDLTIRVKNIEQGVAIESQPKGNQTQVDSKQQITQTTEKAQEEEDDDDDDVDLFGSDSEEEDEEAKKVREERLSAYAKKKSNKKTVIAKSMVILDVKPWDDETDMKEMEDHVRTIEMDGLLWGASKLVPLAYGIKKLQISTVVEDEKVSIDDLQEKIEEFEDFVQSVDIAAFNKL